MVQAGRRASLKVFRVHVLGVLGGSKEARVLKAQLA